MKMLLSFLALLGCISTAKALESHEEEVVLATNDNVRLRGTLTHPGDTTRAVPLAILIAGSGPTDRNGNNPQMENNSLRMLADSLAAAGIASLRYDKRGIGASRTAGLKEEDLRMDDYADDLRAWIEHYAQDGRFTGIVLIGHSEGSLVGLIAAQDNPAVKAFVSIAGAGCSADRLLKRQLGAQSPLLLALCNPIIDSLKAGKTVEAVPAQLSALFRPSVQPYLISWFRHDPTRLIASLSCPVLIVQGDKDIQVSTEDADSLAAVQPSARAVVIRGMSHVLKTTDTTDRMAQMVKVYMDPTLPLNGELVQELTSFIKGESARFQGTGPR